MIDWWWVALSGCLYDSGSASVIATSLDNFGRCLREAAGLATLEARMMSAFAQPIVIRVDPTKEREIADRLRSMSGVGQLVHVYKRCRFVWRGISAPLALRGKRCAHEEGHAGAHSQYSPGEEDAS